MRKEVEKILALAEIDIGGNRPWDLHIHDPRFYERVWTGQHLGLGESYMDGWWDCERLDEFIARLLRSNIENKLKVGPRLLLRTLANRMLNFQTRHRAKEVAVKHYDLGNDLYRAMLDANLSYTCAYWKDAQSLDEAQVNKLELVCQKLMLKPGQRLLDIGCGWGALAKHAAQHYGVEVVGITLSEPQRQFAVEACAGLPVSIRLQDYRDLPAGETFDRVASLGMLEHVGHRNLAAYMEIVANCLADDGIFLLHSVGQSQPTYCVDPFISKYIFPNANVPSLAQVAGALEGRFQMEDWHNFGNDYDKTLVAWHANVTRHWPTLQAHFDERFYRMWSYYLLSGAGTFRARKSQLWQIVLSKDGIMGGFPVRDLAHPAWAGRAERCRDDSELPIGAVG